MSAAKIVSFALLSLALAGDVLAEPATPATPAELERQGALVVSDGTALSQSVQTMLEAARNASDIVKVGCLDAKLAQINAVNRIAAQRLAALKSAVESGVRAHEFTVLTVLGQKFQVLRKEANQCSGQSQYETGIATVVMTIDGVDYTFEANPTPSPIFDRITKIVSSTPTTASPKS